MEILGEIELTLKIQGVLHKVKFVVVSGLSNTSSAILGWDWIKPNLRALYPNRIVVKSRPVAQISVIHKTQNSKVEKSQENTRVRFSMVG